MTLSRQSLRLATRWGFSLIELLVVVGIILIIAAFALPNLLRSKLSANEASAAATLRVLFSAENLYVGAYNVYSPDLTSLGPATPGTAPNSSAADLADRVLSGQIAGQAAQFDKAGYRFRYTPIGNPAKQFAITADPISRGATGQHSFYMDQSGVIRWNSSATATSTDPVAPAG